MQKDCEQIERAVSRGEPCRGPGFDEHLAACPACRELVAGGSNLVAALSGEGRPALEVDRMGGTLEARLGRERGPLAWLRAQPTRMRVGSTAVVAATTTALVVLVTPRADLQVYPHDRMAIAILPIVVVLVWLAMDALRPLHLPWAKRLRTGLALGAGLLVPLGLALMPPAHLDHPASLAGAGEDFWARAIACLLFGMVTGLPLLIAAQLFARGTPGALDRILLALVGAGVAGNLALQLHCPITHPAHLLVGHATVGLGLVLVLTLPLRLLRKHSRK